MNPRSSRKATFLITTLTSLGHKELLSYAINESRVEFYLLDHQSLLEICCVRVFQASCRSSKPLTSSSQAGFPRIDRLNGNFHTNFRIGGLELHLMWQHRIDEPFDIE